MNKVISLGRNCEVQFQINKYCGEQESLFAWSFVLHEGKFLELLEKIESLGQDEFMPAVDVMSENWQTKRDEFVTWLHSNDENVFIKKLDLLDTDEITIQEYVERISEWFVQQSGPNNQLYIVTRRRYYDLELERYAPNRVHIRYVDFFAPEADANFGADQFSWFLIFQEIMRGSLQRDDYFCGDDIVEKQWQMAEQIHFLKSENRKLRELVTRQERWNAELYEAKRWLEGEYLRMTGEGE